MESVAPDLAGQVRELEGRVERLEQSLQSLLEERRNGKGKGNSEEGEPAEKRPPGPPSVRMVPGNPYEQIIKEQIRRMGLADVPLRSAEEIQEQMIRDGVDPEERIAQKILSEMRGYGPDWGE